MHRLTLIEEKILNVQGAPIRVQKKMIKSLRLRLLPPYGEIRLSVPHWYSDKKAEQFVLSRWDWIIEQQKTIHSVHPLARQCYEEGEQLLFRGRFYTLRISNTLRRSNSDKQNSVKLADQEIWLFEKLHADREERRKKMERWYRREMKRLIDPIILSWAAQMQVEPSEWRIKKMSSRWGSCNTRAGRIWLNLELVTMKPELMEYVIVHELAHLLEASHNKRFKTIMDSFLPEWRKLSRELKSKLEL